MDIQEGKRILWAASRNKLLPKASRDYFKDQAIKTYSEEDIEWPVKAAQSQIEKAEAKIAEKLEKRREEAAQKAAERRRGW